MYSSKSFEIWLGWALVPNIKNRPNCYRPILNISGVTHFLLTFRSF